MGHLDLVTSWNFNPEITQYFSTRPTYDPEKQNLWMKNTISDITKKKYIIVVNPDQIQVGLISLMKIDWMMAKAEYGITIGNQEYLGKGIAHAASHLLFKIAFGEMKLKELYLWVFAENHRAIKLFERLGFKQAANIQHTDEAGNNLIYMQLKSYKFLHQ